MLLTFTVDRWHCALPLAVVERSYHAVAVNPLPGAPEKVMGVVNVHGTLHPVIDLRRCLGLPPEPLSPAKHMILGHASRRSVVLIADQVAGVQECAEEDIASAESVLPDLPYISGVARLPDGLMLIHDLDRFLSLDEEAALDRALEA